MNNKNCENLMKYLEKLKLYTIIILLLSYSYSYYNSIAHYSRFLGFFLIKYVYNTLNSHFTQNLSKIMI